eukprot:8618675-Pyramimonas_sp.AAC.1
MLDFGEKNLAQSDGTPQMGSPSGAGRDLCPLDAIPTGGSSYATLDFGENTPSGRTEMGGQVKQ